MLLTRLPNESILAPSSLLFRLQTTQSFRVAEVRRCEPEPHSEFHPVLLKPVSTLASPFSEKPSILQPLTCPWLVPLAGFAAARLHSFRETLLTGYPREVTANRGGGGEVWMS